MAASGQTAGLDQPSHPGAGFEATSLEPHEPRKFIDVPASNAFLDEITWLGNSSISEGWRTDQGDYEFKPKSNISREAMAAFMYRLALQEGDALALSFSAPDRSPFTDVPRGHTFYTEITWLASTGITEGYTDGTFRPRTKISREAMAAFMYRYSGATSNSTAETIFTDVKKNHAFAKEISWMARVGVSTGYTAKHGCLEFRPKGKVTREAMAAFMYRLVNGGQSFSMPNCNPPKPPQEPKDPPQVSGYIHAGAYCAKDKKGFRGQTKNGLWKTCKVGSDGRLRWL